VGGTVGGTGVHVAVAMIGVCVGCTVDVGLNVAVTTHGVKVAVTTTGVCVAGGIGVGV
jgi:hypothetical protein